MIFVKLCPDQSQEEYRCVRLEMEQVPRTKVSPMNLQFVKPSMEIMNLL